jgi:nitroreductase
MDLFAAIQARQSVRAYQAKAVEPEQLEAVLAAANQSPSAGNLQAYQIYIVRRLKTRRALAKACTNHLFMAQAPVVLIFCADPARAAKYGKLGEEFFCVQDATIAVAYAQLAATAVGLATCWIGAFDEPQVIRLAGLRAGHRVIALLTLGYAAETPPRTPRRSLSDLVTETGK